MRTHLIVFTLMVFLLSVPATAGIWIQTGFIATQSSETPPGGTETTDFRLIDETTVGYAFMQGFLLGGQYLYSKSTQTSDYSWALGPKGGLLIKGFELTAAYLPVAKGTRAANSFSGAGFAFTLGYHWAITSYLRAGLQVLYWYSGFSTQNDIALSSNYRLSQWAPQFSLGFEL